MWVTNLGPVRLKLRLASKDEEKLKSTIPAKVSALVKVG
jgi:hypothetical protein